MPSKPTLIIYGATAFTAAPLLTHLDDHPEGDQFELILAGRNGQKLDKAKKELKKKVEIVAVELTDEEGVRALVGKGDVVLNLAGPFGPHNAEALIKACAESGKHYMDLAGEGNWLSNRIVPNYDYLASTTGACIVPSCGFDSVPSDLTVYESLRTLQAAYPSLSITSTKSFFNVRGTVAGGTIATVFAELQIPKEERRRDEWALVTSYPKRSSSSPKTLYTLTLPSGKTLFGGVFVMFNFNRMIVRRSWHLSRMEASLHASSGYSNHIEQEGQDEGPSHGDGRYSLRARKGKGNSGSARGDVGSSREPQGQVSNGGEPRHGDAFKYEEAMTMPSALMARVLSLGLGLFFVLLVVSRLFRWVAKRFLPGPGEGASLEKLKKGWVVIDSVSETTDPDIKVVARVKLQGDPGYLWTCYALAESALSLVLPPPEGTSLPPLAHVGGVLTPSTAMGQVLIKRLERYGRMEMDVEVVEGVKAK